VLARSRPSTCRDTSFCTSWCSRLAERAELVRITDRSMPAASLSTARAYSAKNGFVLSETTNPMIPLTPSFRARAAAFGR